MLPTYMINQQMYIYKYVQSQLLFINVGLLVYHTSKQHSFNAQTFT